MGLLGITGLGAELTGAFAQILLAVKALHAAARSTDGLVGQVNRVGPHIGDEPPLVKALGAAHGLPRRQAQLAVGLLLKGAGGEGRNRFANCRLLLNRIDGPGRRLNLFSEGTGLLFTQQANVTPRLETTGAFVEIIAAGNSFAAHMGELGLEAMAGLVELGFEIPVTAAAEGAPGPLSLNQQSNSNRLNPTRREAPGHLFPEQW